MSIRLSFCVLWMLKYLTREAKLHRFHNFWHLNFINYLEKTGSSQYFFSSPKTCLQFLLHPREKPFASGPYENVGARNDSVKCNTKLINLKIQGTYFHAYIYNMKKPVTLIFVIEIEGTFLNIIKAYGKSTASIRVHGKELGAFSRSLGTRPGSPPPHCYSIQSCKFSPEPLGEKKKSNSNFQEEVKLSLPADNMIKMQDTKSTPHKNQ